VPRCATHQIVGLLIMRSIMLFAAFAQLIFAQAPIAPDPHENPVVQQAPEGKKVDEGTEGSPKQPAKASKPPAKASSKAAKAKTAAKPTVPIDPPSPQEVMLGVWKLVPDQSKFEPGPPPRSETRSYRKTPEGIVALVETTDQKGMVHTISYPWSVDDTEHRMMGSELLDTIRLSQIDNLTAEASLRHGTKVLATERRSISADGKIMTIIMTDMTSEERPITVRAVYEKQ